MPVGFNTLTPILFIPILGLLISLFLPRRQENAISLTAICTLGLHLIVSVGLILYWLISAQASSLLRFDHLVQIKEYEFSLIFYFDWVSMVYVLVGAFLTFLVVNFSRRYMHREEGYKRFFNSILMFYSAYIVVVLSGNFETLFVGWEVLGLSSFLLITFYRQRYLPIKNALKVFSIYRIGDVGIILAIWVTHHIFAGGVDFSQLANDSFAKLPLHDHPGWVTLMGYFLLVTAAAKSAQLPFTSWLPRAMEGPTPSSAIFYGALSVHIGVFLLLRTENFWHDQTSVRIAIGLLGLATTVVSTLTSRVQSSIKSQIAYASTAQIGIMFVEVALGLNTLVLLHFAGNACLRAYQLLISPSIVAYLIREQMYQAPEREDPVRHGRLFYTLYSLSIQEWGLDGFLQKYLWRTLKLPGFRQGRPVKYWLGAILTLIVLAITYLAPHHSLLYLVCVLMAMTGCFVILKAFSERHEVLWSWGYILAGQICVGFAVFLNDPVVPQEVALYLSGFVLGGLGGAACLLYLERRQGQLDLDSYHGYCHQYPRLAVCFFLCLLAISGFPISLTFVGEDLLFSHIHPNQMLLCALVALCFIVNSLALIRVFSRLFLGPDRTSAARWINRSS